MIIFNTIKKAEHYVKYFNKSDYSRGGDMYCWEEVKTYIEGKYVLQNFSGDSCGCGCDNHIYNYTQILGRIKGYDIRSIRNNKLKTII